MPTKTISYTSAGACACCDTGCDLTLPTLLIDGTSTNYADSTAATAAIADQVAGCLVEALPSSSLSPGSRTTFTAGLTANVLDIADSVDGGGGGGLAPTDQIVFRVYLTAADDMSFDYSLTGDTLDSYLGVSVELYEDDQTTNVDTQSDSTFSGSNISGTFNFTVPSDGYYYVKITFNIGPSGDPATALDFTGSCDGGADAEFCTVRAAYDDGAGTSYVVCT